VARSLQALGAHIMLTREKLKSATIEKIMA